MNSSSSVYPSVTVSEPDDELDNVEIDTSSYQPSSAAPGANYSAVEIYDEALAKRQRSAFEASIKQQTKTTDDSKTAYGESLASSFGQRGIAPMPEPSAPPLEFEDWQEYQSWMHAPSYADRSKFPNHKRWEEIINMGQERFRLNSLDVLNDTISAAFKAQVLAGQHRSLFAGHGMPPQYVEMETYMPTVYKAQAAPAQRAGFYDQIQEMIAHTDEVHKISYLKGKITGQEIASNSFYVISDHNGQNSGRNLQIWGPGTKQGFGMASADTKQNLNKVQGAADSYNINVDYAHVSNRFTIIRINLNELGFSLDRQTNHIKKMLPGRYLVSEKEFAYIGKTKITASHGALSVTPHLADDPTLVALAQQLEIVFVPVGHAAFINDNNSTYMLSARPDVYILNKLRGERFQEIVSVNQQLIVAQNSSYAKVNQLQPGQFVVFRYAAQLVTWFYDPARPELNTLYLPNNQFAFNNKVHSVNESHLAFATDNVNIVNLKPGQALIVRDQEQQVRFIEETQPRTIVLRSPWQFIAVISQNQVDYRAGSKNEGNEIVRLMLRSSEWAAVLDKTGHLAFYPPRLDNKPYYFLQPEHTVIQVINKNTVGETKMDVPGVGNVSVVNIPSGSIGACRIRNMHFFLNPSDMPYVFVPPDAFIKVIDSKQPHNQVEDLHRIVLKPEERAIISKDGKVYCLPAKTSNESIALSEENGVYVFRSFQLQVYGPVNKSQKQYNLGPIQYFNVGVGEVAYGTLDGKLKIWEAGEHSVDNRKNEWFTNFFSTNVDPVDIKNLNVTFKHGITGKVDVYVQYNIVDSEKAIRQFKDHETLHQFIAKTTSSEMIKLCASRPPLGYTDLYFSSDEDKKSVETNTMDASKAVNEIEDSFMSHAEELLNHYGVHISKMYIDSWALAEDFVKQVQANAKSLQDAHARIEQARMNLQQSKIANDQEVQRKSAEITLKQNENKRLELELEAQRLRQENESRTTNGAKILEAEAQAKIQEQAAKAKATTAELQANTNLAIKAKNAENDAQITLLQAKRRTEIAEAEARASTAGQRVEAETLLLAAQNKLEAKRIEIEAKRLEIDSLKERGLSEATVEAAKVQAQYAGLNPDQRMQLQLAEISQRNMTQFLQMMLKSGIQMPGATVLDPHILQILQIPQMVNASSTTLTTQRNFNTPFTMFMQPAPPVAGNAALNALSPPAPPSATMQ